MKRFVAFLALLIAVATAMPAPSMAAAPTFSEVVQSGGSVIAPADKDVVDEIIARLTTAVPLRAGMACGAYGEYPTLSYKRYGAYDLELGYIGRPDGGHGLARVAIYLLNTPDGLAVRSGLTVYPGSAPSWGVYLGAEQYIASRVSLSCDIYPVRGGDGVVHVGGVAAGGRVYW